jgi:hypothetical protein
MFIMEDVEGKMRRPCDAWSVRVCKRCYGRYDAGEGRAPVASDRSRSVQSYIEADARERIFHPHTTALRGRGSDGRRFV